MTELNCPIIATRPPVRVWTPNFGRTIVLRIERKGFEPAQHSVCFFPGSARPTL